MARWIAVELAVRALLLVASTACGLAALELLLRLTPVGDRLFHAGLFYQGADLPVHRCAADPFLHYELDPGAVFRGVRPDGSAYTVHIDPSGGRAPAHSPAKSPNTFRILCYGGSTMYGAGVDDEQTIPAALERQLNAAAGASDATGFRYEAWNFGTSAYTLGQAAHLARAHLDALAPDLVLVQLHNVGRRPFLPPTVCDDVSTVMDAEGSAFFREQFASPEWIDESTHLWLMAHSALYRAAIARMVGSADGAPCAFCDALSGAEARALVREAGARGVPVLFVGIPYDRDNPPQIYPAADPQRFVSLFRSGRSAEFYEVHPPAPVLAEYAALLVDALRDRGVLPTASAAGRQG
jgi:hypothetical protein